MVIGITGRIGSGKSEVARIFQKNGFTLIDVDQMGYNLLENEKIKRKIKEMFGNSPFKDVKIDKKGLGEIVFKDKDILYLFNLIVHPPLIRELVTIVEEQRNIARLVVDCALIFEWGIEKLFDYVVLVKCNEEKIIERMVKVGRTEEETKTILSVQLPDKEKLKKADFVIDNNGRLSELKKKTMQILEKAGSG